jgi:hypothetical protein
MHLSRLVNQQRTGNAHGLGCSTEQLRARNEKVRTSEQRQFRRGKRIDNRANPGPVHLADAHRTWFATRVENAAPNLIAGQAANRFGDEIAFGMRRRIAIGHDGVLGRQDDVAIDREQRAEWMVARTSRLASQFNRLPGEAVVAVQVEEVEEVEKWTSPLFQLLFSVQRGVYSRRDERQRLETGRNGAGKRNARVNGALEAPVFRRHASGREAIGVRLPFVAKHVAAGGYHNRGRQAAEVLVQRR